MEYRGIRDEPNGSVRNPPPEDDIVAHDVGLYFLFGFDIEHLQLPLCYINGIINA
jgi:hypothetical protein